MDYKQFLGYGQPGEKFWDFKESLVLFAIGICMPLIIVFLAVEEALKIFKR